jgi:dTDP-4-amino-4,6-dideoxygalactose transaminase
LSLGARKGDFPVTENQSERILSLPIHQYLSEDPIFEISKCINEFLAK